MSGADRLEDTFPHGTVEGFNAGCRGGWCPEGNEHGLSCKKAKQLDAGDYRYQRLVKRGLTPGAIADELGLAPETHPTPARKPEPEPIQEEPDMPFETFTKPAPKGTPQRHGYSEVRAWARANGIHVNAQGRVPKAVMEAFDAAHAETPAERPAGPSTHDEAPETGTSASQAQGASDVPPDTLAHVFTEPIFIEPEEDEQHTVDVIALMQERDTAEAALALTLQKWDAVTQQLRLEKVVNEVLRAHNLHVRLLESASASAEANERILDDYAAEIRRNHDEIARLRDELEQARQPWWKRAAS